VSEPAAEILTLSLPKGKDLLLKQRDSPRKPGSIIAGLRWSDAERVAYAPTA